MNVFWRDAVNDQVVAKQQVNTSIKTGAVSFI